MELMLRRRRVQASAYDHFASMYSFPEDVKGETSLCLLIRVRMIDSATPFCLPHELQRLSSEGKARTMLSMHEMCIFPDSEFLRNWGACHSQNSGLIMTRASVPLGSACLPIESPVSFKLVRN